MRIGNILDKLCSFEISKDEAKEQIIKIIDRVRGKGVMGTIDSISSLANNDSVNFLKIRISEYEINKYNLKKDDEVEVFFDYK
jgi:hypothetical protein